MTETASEQKQTRTKVEKEIENINKYLTQIKEHKKTRENDTYISEKINFASRYLFNLFNTIEYEFLPSQSVSLVKDQPSISKVKFVEKKNG